MRQRVLFKIAVLVFQCLAGQAPSYLSDDCQPVSDSRPRRLRSSDSLSCVVRRAHTYGDRCFGPRVWNSLPAELQQYSSLRQFKRCLKTFLFGSWDYGALWFFVKQRRIEIVLLTYLLTYLRPRTGEQTRMHRSPTSNFALWPLVKRFYSTPCSWTDSKFTLIDTARCSAIAERPCCRVRYSFGQKWKTGTGRQYFTDIIALSSTTVI